MCLSPFHCRIYSATHSLSVSVETLSASSNTLKNLFNLKTRHLLFTRYYNQAYYTKVVLCCISGLLYAPACQHVFLIYYVNHFLVFLGAFAPSCNAMIISNSSNDMLCIFVRYIFKRQCGSNTCFLLGSHNCIFFGSYVCLNCVKENWFC